MTLVQLEYLLAIDRYRSFVRAAEHVSVTQPALTMQIKQLEAELGAVLFDRSHKPLVPTEVGVLVITQARQVLAQSRQMRQLVEGFRQELSGTLRLAVIPTVSPYLVPIFLPRFVQLAPNVDLHISEALTSGVVQGLERDEFDVGIVVTPIDSPLLQSVPLYYERILLYVSPLNALSGRSEIHAHELAAAPLILLREGNCFRTQSLNLCGQLHAHPSFHYDGNSLEALRAIVDRIDAVTLLPELATRGLRPAEQKRVRPFAGPQPLREISLIVRRDYLKTALVQTLTDVIKDEMNQYVPLYADAAHVIAPN